MLSRRTFQAGCTWVLADLMFVGESKAQNHPPVASGALLADLGDAQMRLAARLVSVLGHSDPQAVTRKGITAEGGNVIVSPMSVVLSMAVVALLSSDPMRRSLGRALQFADVARPQGFFEEVLRRGQSVAETAKQDDFPLKASNLLMIDRSAEPFAFTLDGMKQRGIEVEQEDLGSPEAVMHANEWVKARTNGLIPTILDAPPGRGGLIVLNALHFKDTWQVPFDVLRSVDAQFHSTDGHVLPTRMMTGQGSYLFRQARGLGAVDLPFRNNRFSLVLATRIDRPASVASLVHDVGLWLQGAGFEHSSGEVTLPKLNLTATIDLLATLNTLGMRNEPLVSLGPEGPTLRAVTQRTVLKMDEQGAEAAAATAATAGRSVNTDFIKLIFDKPFLFALRDKLTGFIVLSGYVSQPPRP